MPTKRIVLIGVGGASNSGKTTLAKHLHRLIPSSSIIHLDDFAPPQDQIPYSPHFPDLQDWDAAATAIDWPLLRTSLAHVRQTGSLPDSHQSHDHLNTLPGVPVDQETLELAAVLVKEMEEQARGQGEELVVGILDGFLLYWDEAVRSLIDARIFLRVPYATLKERREKRSTYVTQTGSVWQDPPNYFDNIVWPAYVDAHSSIFSQPSASTLSTLASSDLVSAADADRVEHGPVEEQWSRPRASGGEGLVVLQPEEGAMGACVLESLEALKAELVRSD